VSLDVAAVLAADVFKNWRGLASRYDKTTVNYLGGLVLGHHPHLGRLMTIQETGRRRRVTRSGGSPSEA
jgi:hypothetical protein